MHLVSANVFSVTGDTPPISMRCASCDQIGSFESVGQGDINFAQGMRGGQRRCPNLACHAHTFIVCDLSYNLVASYPPEVIDFDATNVPARVKEALAEAITSHANECYTAAAIMVRKTLEELCADRDAIGDNLRARIKALGSKVVLPQELLDGIDDLRLLGNDAAHIESREYDQVGQEEVEIGIEVAKEVLKAVYQMSELVGRLRALKAQQTET